MPSFIESLIKFFKIKYIVDYDDAIFHNYDKLNAKFYKKKFNGLLTNSSLVIVCNEYLYEFADKCGAKNVLLAPTVVDMKKYQKKSYSNISKDFRIWWVGSPSTTKYLYIIKNILEKISEKYPIKLVVMGGEELKDFLIPIEYHKWSFESENQILSSFDVGIMPLHKTKWEEGKCGFKLIQYMASGLPVIASCVGHNRKIVHQSFVDFDQERTEKVAFRRHEWNLTKSQWRYYFDQKWLNLVCKWSVQRDSAKHQVEFCLVS